MSERDDVQSTWHKTRDAAAERALDAKIDRHFRMTHRGVPKGRSFIHWEHQYDREADKKFRENFDRIFPNAPGAGI